MAFTVWDCYATVSRCLLNHLSFTLLFHHSEIVAYRSFVQSSSHSFLYFTKYMIISGESHAFASLLHWGIFCVGTKIVFPISKINSMADSTLLQSLKVVP